MLLFLQELVKYCEKLGEDTTDLCRALELMLGIPHRAEDLKFITNIEGYHGDIHKLGRLLRHVNHYFYLFFFLEFKIFFQNLNYSFFSYRIGSKLNQKTVNYVKDIYFYLKLEY